MDDAERGGLQEPDEMRARAAEFATEIERLRRQHEEVKSSTKQ